MDVVFFILFIFPSVFDSFYLWMYFLDLLCGLLSYLYTDVFYILALVSLFLLYMSLHVE